MVNEDFCIIDEEATQVYFDWLRSMDHKGNFKRIATHKTCLLYIWYITAKCNCWFTLILRSQYSSWCMDFYKLYKLESWRIWAKNGYKLLQNMTCLNKHVIGLYQIKHFWVPCYLREYFFGGMTTTERFESLNAFIKQFVSSHVSLTQFVK